MTKLSPAGVALARPAAPAARLAAYALLALLAGLVALNLGFFALHAAQVLRYPYPLDYGEGPLISQVDLMRSGSSLWQLYGPLDQPPFMVVNYPPVFLLVTFALSSIMGNTLLAGRLVSLLATLACAWGVAALAGRAPQRPPLLARALLGLAFLCLPVVREWAVVMRVDMLGVALGVWGLLAALRAGDERAGRRWVALAALLLALSLLTKPSLLAAPAAAMAALLLRRWPRGLALAGLVLALGGLACAALASRSRFFDHVVLANANAWQADLALGFWQQQLAIHATLFAAGALGALVALLPLRQRAGWRAALAVAAPPLVYAALGTATALGVGKVGAYLNYFLELYIGLIWLAALALRRADAGDARFRWADLLPHLALLLLAGALVRYYPSWSERFVKGAGIIEGSNPPRLIVGRRGVWQDLRRERQILAVMARSNAALVREVAVAPAPILTDIPGVAAQARHTSRLQAFEHSQTLALWDMRSLRVDLANGAVPLVALDYLGNWLTPEVIALITHRYAQDGSRGTIDLYRPLDTGELHLADTPLGAGLRLGSYGLPPQPLHPGEILPVTLVIKADAPSAAQPEIAVTLADAAGATQSQARQPLAYGAVAPAEIPPAGVQHIQPLALPADLSPGTYTLFAQADGGQPQRVASVTVAAGGAMMASGWIAGRSEYVPPALYAEWQRLGGEPRLGLPLGSAAPFVGYTQQCFLRGCLRLLLGGQVAQAPVGVWLAAGDIGANGAMEQPAVGAGFAAFYQQHGGQADLGAAVTNEFRSGDRVVQYTEFARLERPADGGVASFGAVGVDVLRLPEGTPYRWP